LGKDSLVWADCSKRMMHQASNLPAPVCKN
jgi:hypothetical protein